MVTCAASGCKNTSIKGVKMNYFPKDINRRKIWQKNANLENKTLSSSAALCEFHFTSNMWEKIRADGTKKLKNTAVPTIFGELVTQEINGKTTVNRNTASLSTNFSIITSSTTDSHDIAITIDDSQKNPKEENNQSSHSASNTDEETEQLSSDGTIIQDIQSILSKQECNLETQISQSEKIKKLEKLLQKSEFLRITMKKNHKRIKDKYKNKIKALKEKVSINEQFPRVLQQLLNEDQIKLLNKKYKKVPKWYNATLIKAYQLKFACGYSGYKELINQKFPLPSIRTLNRKFKIQKWNA